MKKFLGIDKFFHFIAGFIIAWFCYELMLQVSASTDLVIVIPLFTSLFVGISKELYDKFIKKSSMELLDVVATFLGGVVVVLPKLISLI